MTTTRTLTSSGTIGDPLRLTRPVAESTYKALADLKMLDDCDQAAGRVMFDRKEAEQAAGIFKGPLWKAWAKMRDIENKLFAERRAFATFEPLASEDKIVALSRELRPLYDAATSTPSDYDEAIAKSYTRRVKVKETARPRVAARLLALDAALGEFERAMASFWNDALVSPGRGRMNKADAAFVAACESVSSARFSRVDAFVEEYRELTRPLRRRLQRELAAAKAPPAPPAPPADETPEEPPQVH